MLPKPSAQVPPHHELPCGVCMPAFRLGQSKSHNNRLGHCLLPTRRLHPQGPATKHTRPSFHNCTACLTLTAAPYTAMLSATWAYLAGSRFTYQRLPSGLQEQCQLTTPAPINRRLTATTCVRHHVIA